VLHYIHEKSINTNKFANNLTFRSPWISFLHLKKELSIDHDNTTEIQKENDDLYKDLEDLFI